MPRLRPLAPFVLPIVVVAASLGCERLAGIDGSFQRQQGGVGGSGPSGRGGEGGAGPGLGGSGGSADGAGQAGASGGLPAMGSGGEAGAGSGVKITVLASGQDNVREMTSDGNTLFWVMAGTEANGFNDGKVLSCSTNGCNDKPTVIASEQQKPEHIARADENLVQLPDSSFWSGQIYWTNTLGGTVLRCPKNTCQQPVLVAEGQVGPAGLGVSASEVSSIGNPAGQPYIYWAATGEDKVNACQLDQAGPCTDATTTVLTDAAEPSEPAAPGPTSLITGRSYVYWLTPGTTEAGGRNGHLYRYRKNPGPAPSRPPGERRLFAMANDLHRPAHFALQSSLLYVTALGATGAPPSEPTLWLANPTGVDGSDDQVRPFVSSPSFSALTVTYNAAYWTANGTLYACPPNGCPDTGPVEVAPGLGAVALSNESGNSGTTADVLYAVKDRSVIKIQIPVSIFETP